MGTLDISYVKIAGAQNGVQTDFSGFHISTSQIRNCVEIVGQLEVKKRINPLSIFMMRDIKRFS
jgi:hypothetical protein